MRPHQQVRYINKLGIPSSSNEWGSPKSRRIEIRDEPQIVEHSPNSGDFGRDLFSSECRGVVRELGGVEETPSDDASSFNITK
jgi:hypothetical protein